MLALPQCQEFYIMFHLKFYQKIVMFLLLYLGFFMDALRKTISEMTKSLSLKHLGYCEMQQW